MRGLGIIKAALVRQIAYRRQAANESTPGLSPRRGRFTRGTPESAALTTVAILVGFGSVTPFIVAAILNPPAASTTNKGGPKITTSRAADPVPVETETIVQKAAVAPDKPQPAMRSAAAEAAEPGPSTVPSNDRQSNAEQLPRVVASIVPANDTAEPRGRTGMLRTEVNVGPRDAESDRQPKPEPVETAAEERQPGQRQAGVAAEERQPDRPQAGVAAEERQPDQPQVAAEERQHEQAEAAAEEPAAELSQPIPKPKPKPTEVAARHASAATRSAKVTTDVRMRAGPRNSAGVITVVRGGSEVEVVDCRHWCEVIHNGKRGWIYKRFVR